MRGILNCLTSVLDSPFPKALWLYSFRFAEQPYCYCYHHEIDAKQCQCVVKITVFP